jgi:hypothetical protein
MTIERKGNRAVRPYLYIEQLVELTPWSAEAIRTMMRRRIFRLGVHYFKPHGANSRPIFCWRAIEEYIEGGKAGSENEETIPLANGNVVSLDEATTKAHRLLSSGA